jgi:hypothetical protein
MVSNDDNRILEWLVHTITTIPCGLISDDKRSEAISIAGSMCTDNKYSMKYRKLLGHFCREIKSVVSTNDECIVNYACKGTNRLRKISKHQVCFGASAYALKFYIMEDYSMEASIIKGCLMWNVMNKLEYFQCHLTNKIKNDFCKSDFMITNMCRMHHKKAHLCNIEDVTYDTGTSNNIKRRPKPYWMCFSEMLKLIPKNTSLLDMNHSIIRKHMREWNDKNDIELFNV